MSFFLPSGWELQKMSLQPARERVLELASNFENGTSAAGKEWAEERLRWGKKWNWIYHLLLRHQSWLDGALWGGGGRQFSAAIICFQRRFSTSHSSLCIKQAGYYYLAPRREVSMHIHLTWHTRSLERLLVMSGFPLTLQRRTRESRLVGECWHCSIANGSQRDCSSQSCCRPAGIHGHKMGTVFFEIDLGLCGCCALKRDWSTRTLVSFVKTVLATNLLWEPAWTSTLLVKPLHPNRTCATVWG